MNYQYLKNKFTDGNGNYIFNVPVIQMSIEDLKDYIEFKRLRYIKASQLNDKYGTIKTINDEHKKQCEYCNALRLVKNNRPDFVLSEKELQFSCF